MISKKVARRIVEYSAVVFFQTLILVIWQPSFRGVVAAFVASVSLVTCLVTVFDKFYDDPSDPKNR